MSLINNEIEIPPELLDQQAEEEFPVFDQSSVRRLDASDGWGGWFFAVFVAASAGVCGAIYLLSQPTRPTAVIDIQSVFVAKSGNEFSYGFSVESFEDLPVGGTLQIELIKQDGQRDQRATFDLNAEPLQPHQQRAFNVVTKTNRAGRDGFSGVSSFRYSLHSPKFSTTEDRGDIVNRVIDVDALDRIEETLLRLKLTEPELKP